MMGAGASVLVVWDSMTGNVKRFVEKLDMNNLKIHNDLIVEEPFVLITYTINFGDIPITTSNFLEKNHQYLKGVASSGNLIWGENYARAADTIAQQYDIPAMHKFELSGKNFDIEFFKKRLSEMSQCIK